MSDFELFFELEGSKYGDGIVLNKHGDNYSMVVARKSKDGGTNYMQWAFPQCADRKPREKAIPLGVKMGNKTEAVAFLRWALGQLEPHNAKPVPQPVPSGDDIPF